MSAVKSGVSEDPPGWFLGMGTTQLAMFPYNIVIQNIVKGMLTVILSFGTLEYGMPSQIP